VELTKQKNYQQAFDLACAELRAKDLKERAAKAGGVYDRGQEGEEILIPFFSDFYRIRFPQVEFHSPGKKTISLVTRGLLLHHLLHADGSPLTGKWVGYKDIPGGLLYAGVFARRVTEPLVKKYGRSAKLFLEAGVRFRGETAGVGDASFTLRALPRVLLQYILWEGDEEFPPSVQLLFDSSVDHFLPLEDIVVLGQITTGRLISLSNRGAE
jgi:hypothetical protein